MRGSVAMSRMSELRWWWESSKPSLSSLGQASSPDSPSFTCQKTKGDWSGGPGRSSAWFCGSPGRGGRAGAGVPSLVLLRGGSGPWRMRRGPSDRKATAPGARGVSWEVSRWGRGGRCLESVRLGGGKGGFAGQSPFEVPWVYSRSPFHSGFSSPRRSSSAQVLDLWSQSSWINTCPIVSY
jgi:hypothetical protein